MNIETLAPYLVGLFGLCGSFIGLLGVGLGALISYLNDRQNIQAQAKERDNERDEQIRKEKNQILEQVILEIKDSIVTIIRTTSEYRIFDGKRERLFKGMEEGLYDNEEFKKMSDDAENEFDRLNLEIRILMDTTDVLINSLEGNFASLFDIFAVTVSDFFKLTYKEGKERNSQIENQKWDEVRYYGGNLQKALNEKLISLRDTE